MKLIRVPSYQTTDNKLFADRAEAHTHQLRVDMRGLIQSNNIGKLPNITATDVAAFIAQHAEAVMDLLRKYKEDMRQATKKVA